MISPKDFSTEWTVIVNIPANVTSYTTTVNVPVEIYAPTRGQWSHYQFKSVYCYRQNNFYNTVPEWNLIGINTSAPGEQVPISTNTSGVTYITALLPNILTGTRYFGPPPPKYILNSQFPNQMTFQFFTYSSTPSTFAQTLVLAMEYFL